MEIEMSMEVRNRTQSGVVEMKEKINGNDKKVKWMKFCKR